MSEAIEELALHLRTELADQAPHGFHFNDHVLRQDAALDRLVAQLRAEPPAGLGRALGLAVQAERDGWTLLKLLEVIERLNVKDAAEGLLSLVEARREAEDDRGRFLAGRASEVLLKLPLDLDLRARANAICQGPLEQVARYRMSAQRARQLHRPRRAEWALLVGLMGLALTGVAVAFQALG